MPPNRRRGAMGRSVLLAPATSQRYGFGMRNVLLLLSLLVTADPALHAQAAAKSPASLSSAEMKQAESLFQDYFAAADWEARQQVAAKLAAIDHPSKADVARLAKQSFAFFRQGPRLLDKRVQTCTDPKSPGSFLLDVPGPAKSGKPTGVFICLHGGGAGVGDGAQIESLFGKPAPGLIQVYPTVLQKTDSAWNTEREEQYVLAILEDLKRSFAVDTNRVYLAGHSMGGYGTFSIGPRHADLFAALSAQAGGVFVSGRDAGGVLGIEAGIVFNLLNLPIWFYNSTDDPQVRPDSSIRAAEELDALKQQYGGFDFVFKKYSDIGHGLPKEGLKDIWKFMLAKKRDPLPKRVFWEPTRAYQRHCFWLRHPSPGGAKYDVARDGNRFTVTGGAGGLSILLNEKMVKFDQPVVVVDETGKELVQARPRHSLLPLVESLDAKRDPEMWFSAWVELP